MQSNSFLQFLRAFPSYSRNLQDLLYVHLSDIRKRKQPRTNEGAMETKPQMQLVDASGLSSRPTLSQASPR